MSDQLTEEQLTEEQFLVLMNIVTLAKMEQIKTLAQLKRRAEELGCDPVDIDAACDFWRDDLRKRYPDAADFAKVHRQSPGREPRVLPERVSRETAT